MKTQRKQFLSALEAATTVIPSKTVIEGLENLILEGDGDHIQVTATSISESILASVPYTGEKFACAVNAQRLYQTVRQMREDEVDFKLGPNKRLIIKRGKSSSSLLTSTIESFPVKKTAPTDDSLIAPCKIDAQTFYNAIHTASGALMRDVTGLSDWRTVMKFNTGKTFEVCAANGNVLVYTRGPVLSENDPAEFTIPKEVAWQLKSRLLEEPVLKVGQTEKTVEIHGETMRFWTQKTSHSYPDLTPILSQEFKGEIGLKKDEFLYALAQGKAMVTGSGYDAVSLTFEKDKLTLHGEYRDVGDLVEVIDCKYDGEKIEGKYAVNYLHDIFTKANEEIVLSVGPKNMLKSSFTDGNLETDAYIAGRQF